MPFFLASKILFYYLKDIVKDNPIYFYILVKKILMKLLSFWETSGKSCRYLKYLTSLIFLNLIFDI